MGFMASPYNSIKMALVVEEICKGDQLETGVGVDWNELNPFQWNHIRLNLINKLLNKLSQILLCTIWTDKGIFDCRV